MNNKLMKIMLLITVIVFIIISCDKKPALKNIETDEILIDVSYVDESFLRKYNTYDSFIEDEDLIWIAFTSNVSVKDFSWLSISPNWDDNDELFYEIDQVLYSLKELHPQKPLVVSWTEVGMMSVFGFSYRDKDGQKKYFIGRTGNYGDDPEEYDGPDFVVWQFFPEDSDEVLIDVSYLDESFFENYDTYDSFIEDEDDPRIAFTSNVSVKDFSWLSISPNWDANDELVWGIGEVLYSIKELHPQKPLVVSWIEVGIFPSRGFSYRDENGQKQYYMLYSGNYGDDPEEYDGPDFVVWQFFPEDSVVTTLNTAYDDNLCADNEEILLSFKMINSSKTLSLCVSKSRSAPDYTVNNDGTEDKMESAPDYIVCRYGTKDDIELEFPNDKIESWNKFTLWHRTPLLESSNDRGEMNWIIFNNNGHEYMIYEYFMDNNDIGITIINQITDETIDLEGLWSSRIGSIESDKWYGNTE